MTTPPSTDPLVALTALADKENQYRHQEDIELLDGYCNAQDQRAFAEIVRRYSPMVASLCRSMISDRQLAEDAFQAVFLILIHRAGAIRKRRSLAAWLHGVTFRTASRMRKLNSRVQSREQNMQTDPPGEDNPFHTIVHDLELEMLDRELNVLPSRLREPLIEHYYLGYPMHVVAERMQLSLAAVEGRIRRGRRILRDRLARRGVSLSVGLAGALWTQKYVQATEVPSWCDHLLEKFANSDANIPEQFHHDTHFQQLVTLEKTMLSSTPFKIAYISIAAVSVLTLIMPLTVWSQATGAGKSPVLVVSSNPNGDAAPDSENQTPPLKLAAPNASTPLNSNGNLALADDPFGTPDNSDFVQPEDDQPEWLSSGRMQLEAAESIRSSLKNTIDADFNNVPLRSALEEISQFLEVPIELDETFADDAKITFDAPVTAVGTMPVREALRRLLFRGLTYIVHESSIEITTEDSSIERLPVRYYDLSFVLPNMSNAESLIAAIQSSISDHWDTSEANLTMIGSLLVAKCSEQSHLEIEKMLSRVSQVNKSNLQQVPPNSNRPLQGQPGMGGGLGGMF